MPRKPQDVTDAELSILRQLWSRGPSTIRQITAEVYPANTESDYATVKKLLARLEKKGFVGRNREQTAHRFEALVSRDQLVGQRLQRLADNLCEGSPAPLLMNLIDSRRITPDQQRKLRELIQEIGGAESPDPPRGN